MAQRLTDLRRRLRVAERLLAECEERLVAALDADQPPDAVDALEAERNRLERRARLLSVQVAEEAEVETLGRATRVITHTLAEALTGRPWARLQRRLHNRTAPMSRRACLDLTLLADSVGELSRLRDRLADALATGAARTRSEPAQNALRAEAAPLADLLRRIYRLSPGDAPDLDRLADLAAPRVVERAAPPAARSDRQQMTTRLAALREHLRLIEERQGQYVLQTDIPLQLVREERRIRAEIAKLEQQIGSDAGSKG